MKKVLVVDDNQLVGKLVGMYLVKFGCCVEHCRSPFGVLNKLKEFRPDVVLLDVNMPGLSGRTVAGLIRKAGRDIAPRTIIFSSEDEDVQKKMVEEGLADGYYVKTHSFDGLRERIEQVMKAGEDAGGGTRVIGSE